MGTVLLAAGNKGRRYALPHSTIHMHPAAGMARGSAPDVQIQLNELLRMQHLLQRLLAKHTGQTLERIRTDFDRDYFMNPPQAVEYGLIDEILGEPSDIDIQDQEPAEEQDGEMVGEDD
jgi:ATP-dependent Clp protease protease subunit